MKYIIYDTPPSLNNFAGRKNEWEYRKEKGYWIELCRAYCRPAPDRPIQKAKVTLEYHFCDIRRRDPDNYIKFVMDGLVKAKVIADDSFGNVELVLRQGKVDRKMPRVEITVEALGDEDMSNNK